MYICKALGAGVVRGEGVGEPGKWEMYIDLSSGVLGITLRGGGVCLSLALTVNGSMLVDLRNFGPVTFGLARLCSRHQV